MIPHKKGHQKCNEHLDNPEAKASFIWIIGEYVDTIENSDQLLANFAEGF